MSGPQIARAKAMCAACPVRRTCLAGGLREEWGIWGGYTRPERFRARQLLGTWIEYDGDVTIVPAPDSAVLAAYDSRRLDELVVLM